MSDSVQLIKDRLSILDVISPYVELHRAGKNFKGKSPFTAEKTPSFYVSPDRGMYYCFSTSQGGDMFTFIQAMEGVDFKESLKILAAKAGVELVAEDPKKKTERERFYAALHDATTYYVDQLEKELVAQEYLENRGVSKATLQKWHIGCAPGPPVHGWRMVKEHLEGKGYTKDELFKVGLIKSTEGGKEPFDVFRDRIMFPLFDQNGKVVAFSGRILSKDTEAPKYVNSPETELYKKSELLYGYDKAKHGIRQFNFSLIVEGQFDVVMAHQAGYSNTVAVSGTALTLHHVQLLERLSDRVVLALDADRAGIAAMKRAAELMLKRGVDVKVAEMPMGKDPADIILKDPAEFKQIVGKSVHVIEFLLNILRREFVDDRAFRLATQKEAYPYVLFLNSRVDQYSFAQIISDKTKVPVDVVWHEIEHLREQQTLQLEKSSFLQNKNSTSKIIEPEEKASSGKLLQNIHTYLSAAVEIKKELRTFINSEFDRFKELVTLPEVDISDLAKTVIELEEMFADKKDLDVYSDISARMNIFRMEVANCRLAELRQGENDFLDDIEKATAAQKSQELKRESSYTVDILAARRD